MRRTIKESESLDTVLRRSQEYIIVKIPVAVSILSDRTDSPPFRAERRMQPDSTKAPATGFFKSFFLIE